MAFRKHEKPLTLNFINYDTTGTHVVHGLGSIPHQNVTMPLMKAPSAGSPGGVYKVVISSSASQGQYYYHDIENSSLARMVRFNVANPTSQAFQSLSLSEEMRSPSSSTEPHAPTHCSHR